MNGQLGQITVNDTVFKSMAARATLSVEGITEFGSTFSEKVVNLVTRKGNSGINIEVGTEEIAVDMKLVLEYGRNIPETAAKVQKAVRDELQEWTGYRVVEVNVLFVDLNIKTESRELARAR
ncbi:Asp23/Gls24 family envelope stress response protein [Paenibacillus pabuli]|uniref:Asp23/Gls24 family envelope stress response protein n=1 Tax=Paenibacillus pabuli TaxID=1472 RepID=UPI003242D7C8